MENEQYISVDSLELKGILKSYFGYSVTEGDSAYAHLTKRLDDHMQRALKFANVRGRQAAMADCQGVENAKIEELTADLKTSRATINVMTKTQEVLLARIAELEAKPETPAADTPTISARAMFNRWVGDRTPAGITAYEAFCGGLEAQPKTTSEIQTDVAKRLLRKVEDFQGNSYVSVFKADLIAVCCEANRYYTGMQNWKAAAEANNTPPLTLSKALNATYPIPDTPHTSVRERAMDDRQAFMKGWNACVVYVRSPEYVANSKEQYVEYIQNLLDEAKLGQGSYHTNYDGNKLGAAIESMLSKMKGTR